MRPPRSIEAIFNAASAGASPFVVGVKGRVQRIERDAAGAKPIRNFFYMLLAVGVIQVLAGGKNFDRLRAAAHQTIQ